MKSTTSQLQTSNFITANYSSNYESINTLIFSLETSKSVFFTHLTIKVYRDRISLEYRPFIGGWERRETYNALDIGNVQISKGRKKAIITVYKVGGQEALFEFGNLSHREAEDFKDALDEVLHYRYLIYTRA